MSAIRFNEGSSGGRISGTIRDRDGDLVPASEITAATLTWYDQPTEVIINGREEQDILGVGSPPSENGVTLYETLQTTSDGDSYNFIWILDAADTSIADEDLLSVPQYTYLLRRQIWRRKAMFRFAWATGELVEEIEVEIVNLRKAV